MTYDHVILGAGIYGLYAALILAAKKKNVLLVEMDAQGFSRASFVNQARVHNGYHYPRSLSTAKKSAEYFYRFANDFGFAINNTFEKIYALSKSFSYTSADQFVKFCNAAEIMCEEVSLDDIINQELIEASFKVEEYAFDATLIHEYLLAKLQRYSNVTISYQSFPVKVKKSNTSFEIVLNTGHTVITDSVINATYASTNQIAQLFGFDRFKIKYEICEIIVCNVSNNIKNMGITVMDGPFFSLMPFGKTGQHSLTSVTFTPHATSNEALPTFSCQTPETRCTPTCLRNCNFCPNRPQTSWPYMSQLALKYLVNTQIEYLNSHFAIKPILKTSEIDDSRPTVARRNSDNPEFISILSGKINTIYDLDDLLI